MGASVTFTASTANAGTNPAYQWQLNGNNIAGATSTTYTTTSLSNNDAIRCILTTNNGSTIILSNIIVIKVNVSIAGTIKNPLGTIIPNVNVAASVVGIVTTVDGKYNFSIAQGNSLSVRPFKNNDSVKINGITVLDALLIQGHILGKFILNSPYKIIAADVDNSGDVSVLDIIYTKRLILGIDTTFKGKRLWAFVDSAYQFADATNLFPYKDSIGFANIAGNKLNQNFIGVKLGDVNYDWDNTIMGANKAPTTPIQLYYNNITVRNETEIRVPVRVKNF